MMPNILYEAEPGYHKGCPYDIGVASTGHHEGCPYSPGTAQLLILMQERCILHIR
jgi:hypothetical protein